MSDAARSKSIRDLRFERIDNDNGSRAMALDNEAIEARWQVLQAQNPRLHDGPVLSLDAYAHATGRGRVRVDTYRRLCVQPEVETGVVQLSVTGLLTTTVGTGSVGPGSVSTGSGAEPAVLLARRSEGTRMYGSCWELAPSGGIDPPPERVGARWLEFDGLHVFAQLMREAKEELGLALPGTTEVLDRARCFGVVRDDAACSADLVIAIALSPEEIKDGSDAMPVALSGTGASWEYTAVRWVPASELGGFLQDVEHAGTLVPTVVPALRLAGLLA